MGNKNRNRGNRGNNQGNNNQKNHQQTPVERIKFLYEKSRQRNDIEVLVNDSLVKSNPRIIVELSSEFVEPVLGMGLMTDLIDSETQTLCARMVLQAIKDFRSFNNDEDSLTRIFNRIASDAVNNQEFESLGDDLFTAIQAEFPDVTDADAMRLAIYVFVNSTLKSILGSDDIQTEEDENIEVSASTSTAEPETTDQKESQEQIETEETPLIEHKEEEAEKNPVIDVEYREVETPKSDSSNSDNGESSDSKTDFEVAVMARLEELSELAVKEALPIVKDFCEKSDAMIGDNDIYDTIKSVSMSKLSTTYSPDELLKGDSPELIKKVAADILANVCGKLTEISIRNNIVSLVDNSECVSEKSESKSERLEETSLVKVGTFEYSDDITDSDTKLMTRLDHITELVTRNGIPVIKSLMSGLDVSDDDIYDALKTVSLVQLMDLSPEKIFKYNTNDLINKVQCDSINRAHEQLLESLSIKSENIKDTISPVPTRKPVTPTYKYGNNHADAFMRFMGVN